MKSAVSDTTSVRSYMNTSGFSFKSDDNLLSIPEDLLKEKVSDDAFTKRMNDGDFVYDQIQYEMSLGPCEDRPIHNFLNGTIYLGQWLKGSKIM